MPDIQFFGHSTFRIRGKEGVIVTDPVSNPAADFTKLTGHVVTLSGERRADYNTDIVKPVTERVFVVDGPGEYEIGGVMLHGVRTYRDDNKGADRGRNTVYVTRIDDFTFCHLGDLGHDLTTHQLEEIGSVDVLLVSAASTLAPDKLTEIISEIEPRLVIPMYDTAEQLERLAHELGLKEWTAQEKATISASTLPPEGAEMHVMVLQPVVKA